MSWSRILVFTVLALAVPAAFLGFVWLTQRRLIYFPLESYVPPVRTILPRGSEVSFQTADGLRLGGWFLPADSGSALATVLVFNGNAGSRSGRAPLAAALARRGLAVLLFDYRGYGGNPGRPTETGLIEDARAARRYLASRPEADATRIVYFGESLGAAVAVALAAEHPPAVLVLRSPFTSLVAVGRLHYPYLPAALMLVDRYPAIEQIRGVSCPLLIVAGDRDSIVPLDMSLELFEAAPSRHKRFVKMEGVGHNDEVMFSGERLIEEVLNAVSYEPANSTNPSR